MKPGRRGPRLGQTRPSALRLCGRRIGDREVVQERFVGPLTGVVTRQAVGLVGGRTEARRSGGEAQVLEDLPDLPAGRQATAGRSMTAMTFIVPPHCGQRRGSYECGVRNSECGMKGGDQQAGRMRRAQDRRSSRGA